MNFPKKPAAPHAAAQGTRGPHAIVTPLILAVPILSVDLMTSVTTPLGRTSDAI